MRVKQVKPHEIPLHLLRQKKVWDISLFHEYAVRAGDSWRAFVMDEGDEGDPFAAVIISDAPLSMAVDCHTIIVDKVRRTPDRVAAAAVFAHEAALSWARELGRPYAGCGVKNPEKFMEILGNPPTVEILETIVRETV